MEALAIIFTFYTSRIHDCMINIILGNLFESSRILQNLVKSCRSLQNFVEYCKLLKSLENSVKILNILAESLIEISEGL